MLFLSISVIVIASVAVYLFVSKSEKSKVVSEAINQVSEVVEAIVAEQPVAAKTKKVIILKNKPAKMAEKPNKRLAPKKEELVKKQEPKKVEKKSEKKKEEKPKAKEKKENKPQAKAKKASKSKSDKK